ncbi:unnamed protein product [Protopolystoma xenopodis]|uniref:Uncharacterized protein n=1 Tax=Protopolystoma xenopodis TaxID=117903 RepID=A0A3S5CMT2_9PLAT|nr:unnamed protein product [Protopolystoma xenopodis]
MHDGPQELAHMFCSLPPSLWPVGVPTRCGSGGYRVRAIYRKAETFTPPSPSPFCRRVGVPTSGQPVDPRLGGRITFHPVLPVPSSHRPPDSHRPPSPLHFHLPAPATFLLLHPRPFPSPSSGLDCACEAARLPTHSTILSDSSLLTVPSPHLTSSAHIPLSPTLKWQAVILLRHLGHRAAVHTKGLPVRPKLHNHDRGCVSTVPTCSPNPTLLRTGKMSFCLGLCFRLPTPARRTCRSGRRERTLINENAQPIPATEPKCQ